ncbi:hypothetical protein INS49_014268 [Diaporthe citri]|uniref:uncharacterized protein n=1 Tax=Diaporthe citri TaxID=83186 RepID=UPI001C81123A|nr:uncharacterized protein INS49_014268 [Diaporthe citri]KAG6358384.1 hypothetical protein INS49_014268 [Diaporthe citri]
MALPTTDSPDSTVQAAQGTDTDQGEKVSTSNAVMDDPEEDGVVLHAITSIGQYLMENAPVYRELQQLRAKGWENPEGDQFFEKQKRQADENSEQTVQRLNDLMEDIAKEMQCFTRAFTIQSGEKPQRVLDLCMAPGTYLAKALERNPAAHAVAFTLPPAQGGLFPIVSESETVKIHLLDITMLAADMGINRTFDLVLCDGAIRRTHERAKYRFHREARRLLITQLTLGLEHLRPGGTMIVLLHKLERINTIRLIRDFKKFSTVVLFKPKSGHAKRSSFYMVASAIRSADEGAVQAVREWKLEWKVATLGTEEEWREDYSVVAGFGELGIEGVLEEFGPTLVKLGQKVWKTQADALKGASFMKN